MISAISRMPSGPKMLSGGWSNVTRQYDGERRASRISMVFVAGEFWFFIFFLPYHSFLIFVMQSFSSALSSRSFVGRAHIGNLGKQIAVRPNLVLRPPPVCEDGHEGVTGVVGERPTTDREGCWAGGIIGHHIGQQAQCCSPCPLWRISTYVLERVCEDGNEATIVHRFTRQVGLSFRANKENSLRGQRATVRLSPILDRADQRARPQANPFGPKVGVRHFQYAAAHILISEKIVASELLVVQHLRVQDRHERRCRGRYRIPGAVLGLPGRVANRDATPCARRRSRREGRGRPSYRRISTYLDGSGCAGDGGRRVSLLR